MANARGARWAIAVAAATACWTAPVVAQEVRTEAAAPVPPTPRVSRAAAELGLTFGGIVQLHRDKDFRPMPLGARGGYEFDSGLFLGAAGEWTLSLPQKDDFGVGYYQLAAELGYDYSPLPKLGAVPFARVGYARTFQTSCEYQESIRRCNLVQDDGMIGQLGIRTSFRVGRYFFSGFEFHYQFGALENVGFRFSSGARF